MKHHFLSASMFIFIYGLLAASGWGANSFSVASFNLENYLEEATGNRQGKNDQAKAKIRESIHTLNADVLALQELGGTNALLELQGRLKSEGLDYAYWEMVSGSDTNLNIAVLSQFPIVARRPHTHENYLLHGRRFQVTRGFVEVDICVNPQLTITVLAAHLKSRRPVATADEAEMREQEAKRLREIIDARLASGSGLALVVAGDFNDNPDSATTKIIVGRGQAKLIDLRPVERNGDLADNSESGLNPRSIAWTHFYPKEDNYSRLDYLLVTRNLAARLDRAGTYVLAQPRWGMASDHRPIIARFSTD